MHRDHICHNGILHRTFPSGKRKTNASTSTGLASSPPDSLSGELEADFFYKIGQDGVTTLGGAHGGSIQKYIGDNSIGDDDVYVITEYQLFGDPSLKIGGY